MGLFSKRKSDKGTEYTIDPASLKIEKNTEKEIFGKQSFPSVLYTASEMKSGGQFHYYMKNYNEIEFDEEIQIDYDFNDSEFFKAKSKISSIIYSDIKPNYNGSPYNNVVENIFTQGILLKNQSEIYIKKGDNNSIKPQTILICRFCQDLPLTAITHFRQETGNILFYCAAHNEKKNKEGIHTFPIEEFLENYHNSNNMKICTKMSDFKPTIINHSLKVEGRKDFIKIESENIDIDFEPGETYNIDEQLEKIREKKELQEKVKELERLENFDNESSFKNNDEYVREMISSLNYEKDNSVQNIFQG